MNTAPSPVRAKRVWPYIVFGCVAGLFVTAWHLYQLIRELAAMQRMNPSGVNALEIEPASLMAMAGFDAVAGSAVGALIGFSIRFLSKRCKRDRESGAIQIRACSEPLREALLAPKVLNK